MKSLPFAVLSLGFASGGALAQTDSPPVEIPAEPDAQTDDAETPEIVVEGEVPKERRRVCQMETTTGSIMPRRVCRTVAQIEEEERIARESLEIIRRDRDSRSYVQQQVEAGR